MASAPLTIGLAKKCSRENVGKVRKLTVLPGILNAKDDITLPMRLDLRTPCPINSITHVDVTAIAPQFVPHNLVGDGSTQSDQITYDGAAGEHDTAQQFDIKSATVIRLNEATTALSILIIEALWEDN